MEKPVLVWNTPLRIMKGKNNEMHVNNYRQQFQERPTVRWENSNCSFHPARDKDN
jgi:hypothetical protein